MKINLFQYSSIVSIDGLDANSLGFLILQPAYSNSEYSRYIDLSEGRGIT
ncbi:hypothetical protein [Flavobacterium hiemivividum]|nr:hypothetical protein [Flavobacterium hiemivividum]